MALTLALLTQENHTVAQLFSAQSPTKEASGGLLFFTEPLQFDMGQEAAIQAHISNPMQPSDTSRIYLKQAAISMLS